MGYTTTFEGEFEVCPPLSAELVTEINEYAEEDHRTEYGASSAYCQWIAAEDGSAICWDGSEKFYEYKAWLRRVIDRFLTPNDRYLTGTVSWEGEEQGDVGEIRCTLEQHPEAPFGTRIEIWEPPGDQALVFKEDL